MLATKYLPLQEKFWMIEEALGMDQVQWMGDNYHTFCRKCIESWENKDCRIFSFKQGKFENCWQGEQISLPEQP
jgi:hypothetical protein